MNTLWSPGPESAFDAAETYYTLVAGSHFIVKYTVYTIMGLNMIFHLIQATGAKGDDKLFFYSSTLLYLTALILFIVNVAPSMLVVKLQNYVQFPRNMHLSVLAASHVLVEFLLAGVILIQLGYVFGYHVQSIQQREYAEDMREQELAEKAKLESESATTQSVETVSTESVSKRK